MNEKKAQSKSATNVTHLVTDREILDALGEIEAKCGPEIANLFRSIVRAFDSMTKWLDVETEFVRDEAGHMTLTIRFPPDFD